MPMSGTSLQVGVEGNGLALHGDVRHKGKLGFFGGSAVSKTNVSTLDSGATQQEIQDKLNELIQALNNYNLVWYNNSIIYNIREELNWKRYL